MAPQLLGLLPISHRNMVIIPMFSLYYRNIAYCSRLLMGTSGISIYYILQISMLPHIACLQVVHMTSYICTKKEQVSSLSLTSCCNYDSLLGSTSFPQG